MDKDAQNLWQSNWCQVNLAIAWQRIHKVAYRGEMTGSSCTDRGKLGTNRHILTDKKGISLSAVMSSASVHDVKSVTDVVDNAVDEDVFHMLKQRREEKENCNTFVLIKHMIQARRTSNSKTRICTQSTIQEKKKRNVKLSIVWYIISGKSKLIQ